MTAGLDVRRDGGVAYVTLARPEVRNAFDAAAIGALHAAFDALGGDATVRAIVLGGAGPAFCGGADLRWMRASLELDDAENVADATRLSEMFRAIDRAPQITIARVHGAALGGGAGLVAACDVAVAASDAVFGFTETTLGLVPAVIAPFVVGKIGATHARALALTGERFDASRALAIGLVHEVVSVADLDAAIARIVRAASLAAPSAIARAKALFAEVARLSYDETLAPTARAIAEQRTSVEGREGVLAFLERRRPAWADVARGD